MVLRLIFKSFIHLDFILVYGISWWLSFIFLHVAVHIPQHHLLKGLFFSFLWFWPLCQILIDHRDLGLFLSSLFCSIDLCVCILMPVPDCLAYSDLVIYLDVRYGDPSYFLLVSQN